MSTKMLMKQYKYKTGNWKCTWDFQVIQLVSNGKTVGLLLTADFKYYTKEIYLAFGAPNYELEELYKFLQSVMSKKSFQELTKLWGEFKHGI